MAELSLGASLSHYRIVSKFGARGRCGVYVAEDTRLHRKVALKTLPAELAENQNRIRGFTRARKRVENNDTLSNCRADHTALVKDSSSLGSAPGASEIETSIPT